MRSLWRRGRTRPDDDALPARDDDALPAPGDAAPSAEDPARTRAILKWNLLCGLVLEDDQRLAEPFALVAGADLEDAPAREALMIRALQELHESGFICLVRLAGDPAGEAPVADGEAAGLLGLGREGALGHTDVWIRATAAGEAEVAREREPVPVPAWGMERRSGYFYLTLGRVRDGHDVSIDPDETRATLDLDRAGHITGIEWDDDGEAPQIRLAVLPVDERSVQVTLTAKSPGRVRIERIGPRTGLRHEVVCLRDERDRLVGFVTRAEQLPDELLSHVRPWPPASMSESPADPPEEP